MVEVVEKSSVVDTLATLACTEGMEGAEACKTMEVGGSTELSVDCTVGCRLSEDAANLEMGETTVVKNEETIDD